MMSMEMGEKKSKAVLLSESLSDMKSNLRFMLWYFLPSSLQQLYFMVEKGKHVICYLLFSRSKFHPSMKTHRAAFKYDEYHCVS